MPSEPLLTISHIGRNMKIKVTEELLKEAKTDKGGYTKAQISFAQIHCGKKWKQGMMESGIDANDWETFVKLKGRSKAEGLSESRKKKSEKQSRVAKARNKSRKKVNADFYSSREWYNLRYRVIRKYGAKCMACGMSPKEHGIVIHVDHIKPRSKFPELELEFNNMQCLCMACNLGKSNKDQTDWLPNVNEISDEEMAEIEMIQAASEYI